MSKNKYRNQLPPNTRAAEALSSDDYFPMSTAPRDGSIVVLGIRTNGTDSGGAYFFDALKNCWTSADTKQALNPSCLVLGWLSHRDHPQTLNQVMARTPVFKPLTDHAPDTLGETIVELTSQEYDEVMELLPNAADIAARFAAAYVTQDWPPRAAASLAIDALLEFAKEWENFRDNGSTKKE